MRTRLFWICSAVAVVVALAIAIAVWTSVRSDVGLVQKLPNGSTLLLEKVEVVSTSYQYRYSELPKPLRIFGSILPDFVRRRYGSGSGSIGVGSDGNTNLIAVTILRGSQRQRDLTPGRLRVIDNEGNTFDACWGASTLGMQDATVNVWQIRAFPRRSQKLWLEFLAMDTTGNWVGIGKFEVPNPLFARAPQWTPESLPITRRDGDLSATLAEFVSGEPMTRRSGRDPLTAPRKTRVRLTFAENGVSSENWRVQKLTISDPTGNDWFPYLDFVKKDFNWAANGAVEFLGALWPGEQACKLRTELVRIAGHSPEEIWEASVPLPAPGTVANLTNRWEREGIAIKLVALASPATDHAGDFKWVAKWWGDDQDKVYALAVKVEPKLTHHRFLAIGEGAAADGDVVIVQHGSQDSSKQAVFFKLAPAIAADSPSVRLKFALQRSRFVEFVARPVFVTNHVGAATLPPGSDQ